MTRYEVVPPGSEVSIIVSELKRIGAEKEREFWGNSIPRVKKIIDEVEEVLSSITPRSKNVKSCLKEIKKLKKDWEKYMITVREE